jgi:hypothetical protein
MKDAAYIQMHFDVCRFEIILSQYVYWPVFYQIRIWSLFWDIVC